MGSKESKQQVYSLPSTIKNPNYFENLSNELIYELFDYLSFHDIYHAFDNLNGRFHSLTDTYSHYVNLRQHTQDDNLHPLPRHIRSLKIYARYQLLFINFSTISSLRGLTLSNLPTSSILHIFNSYSFQELDYIYLGVCVDYHGYEQEQLAIIQQKIFLLGQLNLKHCIFRMKCFVNIEQLPLTLPAIEYLRIDGCQNILIVNNLIDRMPNLKSLRVSILETTQITDQYLKQTDGNNCLTNMIIQIHDLHSPKELLPLFIQHCSNLKTLRIYLNRIKEHTSIRDMPDIGFVNRYQWTRDIINRYLPQLTNIHLCQSVFSRDFDFLNRPCYFSPYVEEIPCSVEHGSYRVSIAEQLAIQWQNTA